MNEQDIISRFEAIEKRLDTLEGHPEKKAILGNEKISLTDHIISLREEGFFSTPKIAREVHDKLKDTYACELNRVEVALSNMGGKKLRVSSKEVSGKKFKAYVW